MSRALLLDLLLIVLLLGIVVVTWGAYDALPDRIPTKFDGGGHVIAWAPRATGAWMAPGFAIGVTAVVRLAGALRPERARGLQLAAVILAVVFGGVQMLVLRSAVAPTQEVGGAMWLFILLGIVGVPAALLFGRSSDSPS